MVKWSSFATNVTHFNIQVNQFNSTGDCLASGMGYNALIWKAPCDQEAILRVAQEEARSRQGRSVPLPHSNQPRRARGGQERGVKRKRHSGDGDDDIKKKKMKALSGQMAQRRRGKNK